VALIKIDWTILLQAANFMVLMLVLNSILYRPLRNLLNRRRESIDGAHGRARELETQIAEKMSRYQEQLQQAKLKGNEEKMALRAAAAKNEAELLASAHQSASEQLQAIKNRVQAEAEIARKSLKAETEVLAAQVAAKVLGRAL
jgi:F-type H+-transporting ATPase subunit b